MLQFYLVESLTFLVPSARFLACFRPNLLLDLLWRLSWFHIHNFHCWCRTDHLHLQKTVKMAFFKTCKHTQIFLKVYCSVSFCRLCFTRIIFYSLPKCQNKSTFRKKFCCLYLLKCKGSKKLNNIHTHHISL